MKKLEGKVAVVTGGNSGIGLATAKRLQEEGAKIAISGRSRTTLDEAVKTIGNGVVAVQADVAKPADLDKFYAVEGAGLPSTQSPAKGWVMGGLIEPGAL